jgi:small subunit ribosomal protein S8
MTDPIADMLTRMRNALKVGKTEVEVPVSKLKFEIAKLLEKESWVESVKEKDGNIKITFKYEKGNPAISYLKRVSKPGCRIYAKYKEMPIVLDGLGIAVVSTPKGVMTNNEAKKSKVGGEILCEIY